MRFNFIGSFNILIFCLYLFDPLVGFSQQSQDRGGDTKPNILFVLVDDMGWNTPSSYGGHLINTPNIDRLADEGMRFTDAHAPSMCTPSRAEFLSGQYDAHTGITEQGAGTDYPYAPLVTPKNHPNKLPEDNYTIANMLYDAGYETMISGKWNVGDSYRVADLKKNHGDKYFKPYGFVDFIGDARDKDWDQIDKDKGNTEIVNDFFEFLKQRHSNKPFFAYLPFFAPHTPIGAPDSLVNKFVDRGFPRSTEPFGDARERPTADYLAMIQHLDNSIGKILNKLDNEDLAKNTLVVFMSDNGALNRAWNNLPLRGAKGTLYEGGVRVPLLMRWPGHIPAKTVSNSTVIMVDMFPTFKEISSASVPKSKLLDGVSLVPLLTQKEPLDREAIFWHRPQYIDDYGQTPSSSIRMGDYKLIHYYGDYLDTKGYLPKRLKPYGKLVVGERTELYNIKNDPGEINDLSKTHPDKKQVLLDSLKSWLKGNKAMIPVKNDNFDNSQWYIRKRIKESRKTKVMD